MKPNVTIIIRSFNDGSEIVRQTLESLYLQEDVRFKLIHIDNFSTDGTEKIIRQYGSAIYQICPLEYIPGRVLNFGMELSTTEYVVFLNADATPVGTAWLASLLAEFKKNDETVAVFSRQIPRSDAMPLFRKDYQRAFGDGHEHAKWPHFFSMAASAIKRSWWLKNPFNNAIRASEDIEWTYHAKKLGKNIAYVPQSIVVHSHNYNYPQTLKRYHLEGEADAWIFRTKLFEANFMRRVLLPFPLEVLRDCKFAKKEGSTSVAFQSPKLRIAQLYGRWQGVHAGLKSSRKTERTHAPDVSRPTLGKYTVDYLPKFEHRIDDDMAQIKCGIEKFKIKPVSVLLGGGYGRREGGVWLKDGKNYPYNDYDLYAIYNTNNPLVMKKARMELEKLSEQMTAKMGVDVDFAAVRLAKIRKAPASIEWYELKRGSRAIYGERKILACMPDYRGSKLPFIEGERLLMNRVLGMIKAREKLQKYKDSTKNLPESDLDFISRNIHKAMLAAGDVILLRFGLYHYSYRKRMERFEDFKLNLPQSKKIKLAYSQAMAYRFKPQFKHKTYRKLANFWFESREILKLVQRWFLKSTLDVDGFDAYASYLLAQNKLSLKSLYNVSKNMSYSKKTPDFSYLSHPQSRIKAAAPILLYRVDLGFENTIGDMLDLLCGLLFMPQSHFENIVCDEKLVHKLLARLENIWREVN